MGIYFQVLKTLLRPRLGFKIKIKRFHNYHIEVLLFEIDIY
jgi:hypothetical protein